MNEREIKRRVTCANCVHLIDGDEPKCSLLQQASPRRFSGLYVECGAIPISVNPKPNRFCLHYEAK